MKLNVSTQQFVSYISQRLTNAHPPILSERQYRVAKCYSSSCLNLFIAYNFFEIVWSNMQWQWLINATKVSPSHVRVSIPVSGWRPRTKSETKSTCEMLQIQPSTKKWICPFPGKLKQEATVSEYLDFKAIHFDLQRPFRKMNKMWRQDFCIGYFGNVHKGLPTSRNVNKL